MVFILIWGCFAFIIPTSIASILGTSEARIDQLIYLHYTPAVSVLSLALQIASWHTGPLFG
jgi:hypothetical protein